MLAPTGPVAAIGFTQGKRASPRTAIAKVSTPSSPFLPQHHGRTQRSMFSKCQSARGHIACATALLVSAHLRLLLIIQPV